MIHCRPCSKTEMNLFKNISMAIKVDGDNKTRVANKILKTGCTNYAVAQNFA